MRILSVGEILWDVFGEREFLGGAPLNFCVSAQRLGDHAALLSAVGMDARGTRAIQLMQSHSLTVRFIQIVPSIATGTAVVTTDDSGNATFCIERPAAFDRTHLNAALLSEIRGFDPDWIYFGTLAQTDPQSEDLLYRLVDEMPGMKCFYDVNLREGHWNWALVERLSKYASIIKLNDSEAETLFQLARSRQKFSLENFCNHWSSAYGPSVICVTLGSRGCAIWANGAFKTFSGFRVEVADTVGAGDAFAAAFLHGYQLGWPLERTASFANALGALVATHAGATPAWAPEDCLELIKSSTKNTTNG